MKESSLIYTKLQWGVILPALFFIDIGWIACSSFQISYNAKNYYGLLIIFLALYLPCFFYTKVRPDLKIKAALLAVLYFLSFSALMVTLSYLMATTNEPFYDSILQSTDAYFGYQAPHLIAWFQAHSFWDDFFFYVYSTYYFQIPVIILYLSFSGKLVGLQRFLMQYTLAGIITIIVFGLFPAAGPYEWFQYTPPDYLVSSLKQLHELRDHILDLREENGIIVFPSFHAIMAMIYMYTFREDKKVIFIPFFVLNALMIFSCLSHGHHYLTDLFGAVIVFALAIGIEQLIFWHVMSRSVKSKP